MAKVSAGQKVLVIGGSGGTGKSLFSSRDWKGGFLGSWGIQLAKHLGAEVTSISSGKNADLVRQLGAAHVVDYTKEDWSEALKGQDFDLVYDTVGLLWHLFILNGVESLFIIIIKEKQTPGKKRKRCWRKEAAGLFL